MTDSGERRTVESFVLSHLRSAEELDILLLLFRGRDRWWSVDDVSAALHMGTGIAHRGLERLSGAFFDVRVDNRVCFRYSARNAERDTLTSRLDDAYHADRGRILSVFGSRQRVARDFADAFRLRREEEE